MHKILTFSLPNDEAQERGELNKWEAELDAQAAEGFKLISAVWEPDTLHNGQGDQVILFLRKD